MLSTRSSRASLGIAAAVVILAVVVGATFMNRSKEQSAVGAPAASASTAPAASGELQTLVKAPAASCPGITDRPACLKPGTYQLGSTALWPAVVTLDVPENWWYYEAGAGNSGVLVQTEDAVNASGWGVIFSTIGSVFIDPCDSSAGTFEADVHTPGELFEVIDGWPGFEATEPEPISNGYDGMRFTLTSTMTTADCPSPVMWTSGSSYSIPAYPMVNAQGRRHATEVRIFDVDGEPLVVMATNFPETSPFEEDYGIPFDPDRHAEDLAAMDAILDSIELKDPRGDAN